MTRTLDKLPSPSPLRQPRDITANATVDTTEITPDKPPPTKPVGTPKGADRPERLDAPRPARRPSPIRGT